MHIYVVFAHPSRKSFTFQVLQSLCSGFDDAGHSYEICDSYEMNFSCVMAESQYARETETSPPNRKRSIGPMAWLLSIRSGGATVPPY